MNIFDELKELQENREEFKINGISVVYKFDEEGTLKCIDSIDSDTSSIELNEILERGICPRPWVPRPFDEYYFVESDGGVQKTEYINDYTFHIENGNFYRTKELAEAAEEKIIEFRKTLQHG